MEAKNCEVCDQLFYPESEDDKFCDGMCVKVALTYNRVVRIENYVSTMARRLDETYEMIDLVDRRVSKQGEGLFATLAVILSGLATIFSFAATLISTHVLETIQEIIGK